MFAMLLRRAQDPYGFANAFDGLGLAPDDLPGLTRNCRQLGRGC